MRQIKFRVFDGSDYMSSPFTLADIQAGAVQFASDCPVMQYTGFKDIHGKEIYEGDIVKGSEKEITCTVKYNDQNGGFYCAEKIGGYLICIPKGEYGGGKMHTPYEIIGNIYENPDLIP